MRAPNEMQTFFGLEQRDGRAGAQAGAWTRWSCAASTTRDRHPVEDVPFSSRSLMECYDAVSESFGWAGRDADGRRHDRWRLAGRLRLRHRDLSHEHPRPPTRGCGCRATAMPIIELAAHDVGTGSYTIFAQIAAARLGLPVGACDVVMGEAEPAAGADFGRLHHGGVGGIGRASTPACNVAAEVARQVRRSAGRSALRASIPTAITLDEGVLRGPGRAEPVAGRRAGVDPAWRGRRRRATSGTRR